MNNKTIFILNGPPASGKTVWGKILRALLSVPIVGVGNLLREMQGIGILSPAVSNAMNAGYLLDSEDIWAFLQPALENVRAESFILDGYPRKPDQVIKITDWARENNFSIRYLNLEQSRDMTNIRSGRRHLTSGTNIILRPDDNPESIITRYNEFERYTRYVADMFMENPPFDFAMVTLNCDQIENLSKFWSVFQPNATDEGQGTAELADIIG